MDIKGTEDKLNQVDSLLTTFTKLLKKHWLILIAIGIGVFIYFALTSDPAPVEEEVQTEEVQPVDNYEEQPVDNYYEEQQPVEEPVDEQLPVEEGYTGDTYEEETTE